MATPSPSTIAVDRLGFFRWGRVAGKVLITTDGGDWAFLSEPEFAALLAGDIREGHPRWAELGPVPQIALLALLCCVPLGLIFWLYRYEMRIVAARTARTLFCLLVLAIILLLMLVVLQPV